MKLIAMLDRIVDVGIVLLVDPDRAIVGAAKDWARLRREHCDGRCENCDALIRSAWERCQRWRYAQQVKRSLGFDGFLLASAVQLMEVHL